MGSVFNIPLFRAVEANGSVNTLAMNGTTVKAGVMFTSNGKQITKIRTSWANVTTPPVYLADLQSVSAGAPTGTILGGATPASGTFTPVAGINDTTLTNPYTPTLGDYIAAIIEYSSGTIGASNFGTLNTRAIDAWNPFSAMPLESGAARSGWPMISVIFADGTIQPMTCPIAAGASSVVFNNGSSPNEVGIKFTAPGNITINGLMGQYDNNNGSSQAALKLYDSNSNSLTGTDNTTVLASVDSSFNGTIVEWITPVTLTAGSIYYLTLLPTSANNVTYFKTTYPDSSTRQAFFGDATFVSRTGTGAWTEDTLSTTSLSPLISAISAGGGASGGIFIGD